jgi:hypothetical protein
LYARAERVRASSRDSPIPDAAVDEVRTDEYPPPPERSSGELLDALERGLSARIIKNSASIEELRRGLQSSGTVESAEKSGQAVGEMPNQGLTESANQQQNMQSQLTGGAGQPAGATGSNSVLESLLQRATNMHAAAAARADVPSINDPLDKTTEGHEYPSSQLYRHRCFEFDFVDGVRKLDNYISVEEQSPEGNGGTLR